VDNHFVTTARSVEGCHFVILLHSICYIGIGVLDQILYGIRMSSSTGEMQGCVSTGLLIDDIDIGVSADSLARAGALRTHSRVLVLFHRVAIGRSASAPQQRPERPVYHPTGDCGCVQAGVSPNKRLRVWTLARPLLLNSHWTISKCS
jgi:hypothetical protein